MYVSRKFVSKTAIQDNRWCWINICIQAWQETASPENILPHMISFKCKMSFEWSKKLFVQFSVTANLLIVSLKKGGSVLCIHCSQRLLLKKLDIGAQLQTSAASQTFIYILYTDQHSRKLQIFTILEWSVSTSAFRHSLLSNRVCILDWRKKYSGTKQLHSSIFEEH